MSGSIGGASSDGVAITPTFICIHAWGDIKTEEGITTQRCYRCREERQISITTT